VGAVAAVLGDGPREIVGFEHILSTHRTTLRGGYRELIMSSVKESGRRGGYSRLLREGFSGITRVVRDTHRAVADRTFATLALAPVVAGPARAVEKLHSSITGGVYAAVESIGSGVLSVAEELEQQWFADAAARMPIAWRSPLNAVFGDHLTASDNMLAIPMQLYFDGAELPTDANALRARIAQPSARICVLMHGLGCSDQSFEATAPGVDLGAELTREFGAVSLYLRYNSGLAVGENARRLAALLESLVHAWPTPLPEIILLGHSMGGLLAHRAIANAPSDARWPQMTRMLVTLGSPHGGSPLARHGDGLQRALDFFAMSAPIGRIGAARSVGIKNLRGESAVAPQPTWPQIETRLLGAHLGDSATHPLARIFGDGLVPISSATTLGLHTPPRSAMLPGVGHLGLMNDPRAWAQVRDWVNELVPAWGTGDDAGG